VPVRYPDDEGEPAESTWGWKKIRWGGVRAFRGWLTSITPAMTVPGG